MLTGLHILLDRMKTNPEEFLKDDHVPYEGESFGGKWSDLVNYAWRIATEEERQMLEDARREFYRDDFNERVMKRLAGEETTQEQLSPYIVKGSIASAVLVGGGGSGGTWTDPRAIYGSQATPAAQATYPHPHTAAQKQQAALQNSAGGSGNFATTAGSTNVQGVVQGGYGQAQVRQEGAAIGVDPSFWGGITGAFWR